MHLAESTSIQYQLDYDQPNRKQTSTKAWVYFRGVLWVYSGCTDTDRELTLTKPKETKCGHRE